jgi:hypothetical protein
MTFVKHRSKIQLLGIGVRNVDRVGKLFGNLSQEQLLQDADLDARILALEKTVGAALYRSILRDYGRVNQPKLIRDAAVKRKVLQILESAARGLDRLHALAKPLDSNALQALLEKLQAPP